MSTRELIEAALEAKAVYEKASQTLSAATLALREAHEALLAANLAVFNDLSAGGPCCIVDDSTDPPTVTLYTAALPDTYTATPIRVAA